jgi:hypothetical protein
MPSSSRSWEAETITVFGLENGLSWITWNQNSSGNFEDVNWSITKDATKASKYGLSRIYPGN